MTIHSDVHIFEQDVTFSGNVTFSETPAEISLDNLTDLTGSGACTFADLVATDDLTVGDDAAIGGDLAVTGATTCAALACTTLAPSGNVAVATDKFTIAAASGNTAIAGTLGITGATTCAALTSSTQIQAADLVATDDLTVGDDATVGGNLEVAGNLAVEAGATTLKTLTLITSVTMTGAAVIGLHEHVSVDVASLVGTGVYGIPCPVAGTVTRIQSRLKAALTTGNATLTAKIGATNITDGVITITQAGSAVGDIDACTPSAANVVEVGSNLSVTVGGTNDAVVGATVVFTILRSA